MSTQHVLADINGAATACTPASIGDAFGLAVRVSREGRGWSQEALAERAELNRSYLGEVERGRATPSLVTIFKLARALDLSPSSLLARCEPSGDDVPSAPTVDAFRR